MSYSAANKPYRLDRKRFIMYYTNTEHLSKLISRKRIVEDLIKGSEFIITAQDLLDNLYTIPGSLVGVEGRVLAKDCELYY